MAPPLDEYIVKLNNWHKRYKLSDSIMNLFETLGHHRRGNDRDALGRLMRTSPRSRKACTDTISQLAKIMAKNPNPVTISECTELIQACTEILNSGSK